MECIQTMLQTINNVQHNICTSTYFVVTFKDFWWWHDTMCRTIILDFVNCPSLIKPPCFRNWFYFCFLVNKIWDKSCSIGFLSTERLVRPNHWPRGREQIFWEVQQNILCAWRLKQNQFLKCSNFNKLRQWAKSEITAFNNIICCYGIQRI